MPTESLDDVLEHYGIKGMKWGVRRTPEQLGRARGKKKETKKRGKLKETPINMVSKDAKQVKTSKERMTKKTDPSPLSNDELKQVIQRMSLEKQYKELQNKEDQAKQKKGEAYIKKVEERRKTYVEVMKFINSDAGRFLIQGIRGALRSMRPIDFADMLI